MFLPNIEKENRYCAFDYLVVNGKLRANKRLCALGKNCDEVLEKYHKFIGFDDTLKTAGKSYTYKYVISETADYLKSMETDEMYWYVINQDNDTYLISNDEMKPYIKNYDILKTNEVYDLLSDDEDVKYVSIIDDYADVVSAISSIIEPTGVRKDDLSETETEVLNRLYKIRETIIGEFADEVKSVQEKQKK